MTVICQDDVGRCSFIDVLEEAALLHRPVAVVLRDGERFIGARGSSRARSSDGGRMPFEVETRNVHGRVTSIGSAGQHTLVIDRPAEAGGGGLGFNGGELLHLAVAGCVSNDLFREAQKRGVALRSVRVIARGDFSGAPAVSGGIEYEVEVSGDADERSLRELVELVDSIAEIPNSLRRGTTVKLTAIRATAS